MNLTPKQRLFVAEYLANDLNATHSGRKRWVQCEDGAGAGSRLLSNVMVAGEIERVQKPRLERLGITAEKVLQEIAKMAFLDQRKLFTPEWFAHTHPRAR